MPLYGVDMAGAPEDAVVCSRALAARLGLQAGAPLAAVIDGRPVEFRVGQIADAGSAEFLAIDIAAAQFALRRYGKLDRIDVELGPDEDLAPVEQAVRAMLPQSYICVAPGHRER